MDDLKNTGENPYPSGSFLRISIQGGLRDFSKFQRSGKSIGFSGRILGLRDQGNIIFIDLADGSGKIQILLKRDELKDFGLIKRTIDIGDFIHVSGALLTTKKGEKSLAAKKFQLLTKSLRPFPTEWYGLKDVEERYRKRYLDLVLNGEVRKKIEDRSKIVADIKKFLNKEGFVEVETPILQEIPGGARARPFITHHNALDQDFYLRIAPELFLKRLLVGGFEKIFELGRVFRNEGIDRDHNPEFTMLELYVAYEDWRGLMKFTEKMLKPMLKKQFGSKKWEEVTYAETFKKYAKKNIGVVPHDKIDDVFKHEVRPKIAEPTFVTHYPKDISPLAKSSEKDRGVTERFQLIIGGTELVNGFSELNDPVDQRERMERQEADFRAGDEESSRLDEEFLEALEYGMPPAAGLGLGIDRLAAIITESHNVKEVIIFPTLRSKGK